MFLKQIIASEPTLEYKDTEGMITIGKAFCTIYDNGGASSDVNNLILTGAGFAYTGPELVTIHGSSVGAYCPEHTDKIGAS